MAAPLSVTDVLAWLHAVAPGAQLSSDSRTINAGDVFVAFPGSSGGDGRRYIAQAVARGARAVVHDDGGEFAWDDTLAVPHFAVSDLKRYVGEIANVYYDRPDTEMFVAAVTGTNGKTSSSQWIAQAISRLGHPSAVVGTLGIGLIRHGRPKGLSETGYTTPDAVLLQRRLADLRKEGAEALAIEASSIGLVEDRMQGLHVDVALFTNFTRDHLDYHGSMEAYAAAKLRLFDWPGLRHAVINLDDALAPGIISQLQERNPVFPVIGYTLNGRTVGNVATLSATDIRNTQGGTNFRIESPFGATQVRVQLVGQFNVSNVLGVLGVLLAKGLDFRTAVDALEDLTPVPGRMQQLGGKDAPLMVIDYAHTPDALEKTLATLRQVTQQRGGQLWCLFGCGGDRDPGKRPQMGKAAQAADRIIVTSDNPRSEDPVVIMNQIVSGMDKERCVPDCLHAIEDRAAAILWAARHASKHDVVLLAGKGHETTQEIKGRKQPFLDADHAALALAARATMKGMHT